MKNLLVILIVLITAGCGDNRATVKEIVSDKIESFDKELDNWNKITQQLLGNDYVNSHLGLYINPKDLNSNLYEELQEQGVIRFSVTKNIDCQRVEYSLDWMEQNSCSLYLTWTSCDLIQTKKGYYKDSFDTNFTEVWGLGNNWLVWLDSDLL